MTTTMTTTTSNQPEGEEAILLTDRTSITTDRQCEMKGWWYKCEGERGIVPAAEASYFLQGRDIHETLALLAEGKPLQAVLDGIPQPTSGNQIELETWARLAGWAVAFDHWELPRLLKRFKIRLIEHEMILNRSPLWVAFTPDLILEDIDGGLVYKEYKTTGFSGTNWCLHWRYAIQVHLGIKGTEEELGERVKFGQVMGLTKGKESYGKLHHPYVWAYQRDGELSPTYKAGWDLVPSWEHPEGMIEWVEKMGEGVLGSVFIHTEKIFLDERMLNNQITATLARMREIRDWKERAREDGRIRLEHFQPNYEACRPSMGSVCPYLAACFNHTIGADPCGSGMYVPRTPHHDVEMIDD